MFLNLAPITFSPGVLALVLNMEQVHCAMCVVFAEYLAKIHSKECISWVCRLQREYWNKVPRSALSASGETSIHSSVTKYKAGDREGGGGTLRNLTFFLFFLMVSLNGENALRNTFLRHLWRERIFALMCSSAFTSEVHFEARSVRFWLRSCRLHFCVLWKECIRLLHQHNHVSLSKNNLHLIVYCSFFECF